MIIETIVGVLGTAVINNAVESVSIILSSQNFKYMLNSYGNRNFQAGDNINILSMGVSVPFGASILQTGPVYNGLIPNGCLSSSYLDISLDPVGNVPYKGELLAVTIPFVPYEMAFGIHCSVESSTNWQLKANTASSGLKLCCVNCNSIFNTKTVSVDVFAKIEHTLEMV